MKLLLDNCIPADLADHIGGHDVVSVISMGWADLSDSALLDAMAGKFDVLVTADHSMPYQQVVSDRPVAIIVLRATSNRLRHLARLIPDLHLALRTIGAGEVRSIGI